MVSQQQHTPDRQTDGQRPTSLPPGNSLTISTFSQSLVHTTPHLLLVGVVSVGAIDTVVETTGVAQVLAFRVPPPERSGGCSAVGAVTVRVVGQCTCKQEENEHSNQHNEHLYHGGCQDKN